MSLHDLLADGQAGASTLEFLPGVQSAKDLRLRGLADAIIVTGAETGVAPDASRLDMLRVAVDAPLIIGSGMNASNAAAFAAADAAIVGTAMKRDGDVDEPVDAARAAAIVRAFKRVS